MSSAELLSELAASLGDRLWLQQCDDPERWIERLLKRKPVTVVIPVFNGFESLSRLLDCAALFEEADEVLLIDDCSSDPRVAAALGSMEQKSIRLLRNARNLGFVRTVNRGLRERTVGHDVLVLNSDTLPGAGWSIGLARSAYAFENVATVSPLSNAAGFFSVPRFNSVNPPPPGWKPEACSSLLAMTAPAVHESVLATCGFCWYLTDQAITQIGVLDEYMFHRGYAEETDFCLRALDAGMRNLSSLSHYVEHVGGQSFSTEKAALKKNNANILKAIQPDFLPRLRDYEENSLVPRMGEVFRRFTQDAGAAEIGRFTSLRVEIETESSAKLSTSRHELRVLFGAGTASLSTGCASAHVAIEEDERDALICHLALGLLPTTLDADATLAEAPIVRHCNALLAQSTCSPNGDAR